MGTVASVDGDTIVVDQLMQVAGKSLAFRIKFFV